jgi:hypothetical protein
VILASSEVAVPAVTGDPARFSKLSRRSRVLALDGLIEVPGLSASLPPCDVVEVDPEPIAKRIVNDLVQSIRPQKTELLIFRAKWIPASGVVASNACNGYRTTRRVDASR